MKEKNDSLHDFTHEIQMFAKHIIIFLPIIKITKV